MRKRKITAVLLIVCALLLTSTIPVYASSDSKQVKKVINTFMKGAKKSNLKQMKKCFKVPDDYNGNDKFSDIDNMKYLKRLFQKNKSITYKIISVKVKGNTAKVKVRMRTPTIKKAMKPAMERYISWAWNNMSASETKSYKKLFSYLASEIKNKGVQMYSHKETFYLEKCGNSWKINKVTERLRDIPLGRIIKSLEEVLLKMS